MQSTVKVACLAALLLALVVRPAAQAHTVFSTLHQTAQHVGLPVRLAEDGSKLGAGGG
ncbi:hypothetical protein MF271_02160 (plasmid) [Deinococcus sp. KNUC1210]|uniref:hypothetical protein n=1 Tax=Deinococcus sp. KNUC1210 TaxID=2917691 RepID=UPI001EEFFB3B|nr:hypothetical protein [Deinococcus sp. KNUC1210]ULH14106.1 hypothetical protein MF271_02160 [Deinococcus sp. KNUC1210]